MGAKNVKKVFAHWRNLDHAKFRMLTYMALRALDDDDPPVYWGGWEDLAVVMNYDVEGARAGARRTTMRVLAALAAEGAIVSSGQAREGVRAKYALSLQPSVTYQPLGSGRNITWQKMTRELATTQGEVPAEGMTVATTLLGDRHGHPTYDRGGPKGMTVATTPRKEPQEQQRNTGEESNSVELLTHQGGSIENDSIDEISPSPSKAGRIRLDTKAEIEDERRRQSAALEKLMREQREVA